MMDNTIDECLTADYELKYKFYKSLIKNNREDLYEILNRLRLRRDFLQNDIFNVEEGLLKGELEKGKGRFYKYPVTIAAAWGASDCFEVLLKSGARYDVLDSGGNNVLHVLAIANGSKSDNDDV